MIFSRWCIPTPLIPVLVTGIQPTRACAAEGSLFSPRIWAGWISVKSTKMREVEKQASHRTPQPSIFMPRAMAPLAEISVCVGFYHDL